MNAKELIEAFAKRQREGRYPCPRCGRDVMDEEPARNAMSRRAHVYVCDECGTVEALEDMLHSVKLPLEEWALVTTPMRWDVYLEKLVLRHIGRDNWSRPVYECGGRLYVDTDPRADRKPDIFTKQGNAFDGEPCDPLPDGHHQAGVTRYPGAGRIPPRSHLEADRTALHQRRYPAS